MMQSILNENNYKFLEFAENIFNRLQRYDEVLK